MSRSKPGEIRRQLPELPPEDGESMDRILDDFRQIILPGVTHWNHPRFFAYFPANNSGPSILGELLSAGLGVNAEGSIYLTHTKLKGTYALRVAIGQTATRQKHVDEAWQKLNDCRFERPG